MGTRFELALFGGLESDLRAAGEEALDEIELLSEALDLFRRDSFLSFLNEHAHTRPVRVDADLFDLFEICKKVHQASEGYFDVTAGSLMACWGFHGAGPKAPLEGRLGRSLETVGFDHVELDPAERTVRYKKPGLRLDFGAVARYVTTCASAAFPSGMPRKCTASFAATATASACGSAFPTSSDATRMSRRAT